MVVIRGNLLVEICPLVNATAALDHAIEAIAHCVPAVIVGVDNNRQNFFGDAINLVTVEPRLTLHIHAARMNYDFLVRLEMRNTVFDAAFPLFGCCDVEALPSHVADCLRPRAIRFDRPLPSLRYAVKKLSSLVELDPMS